MKLIIGVISNIDSLKQKESLANFLALSVKGGGGGGGGTSSFLSSFNPELFPPPISASPFLSAISIGTSGIVRLGHKSEIGN